MLCSPKGSFSVRVIPRSSIVILCCFIRCPAQRLKLFLLIWVNCCICSGVLESHTGVDLRAHAQLYKTIGHMFDFVVPLSLEADIDPMVFGNADDIPFQPVADLDGLEDLVVVDHAPVPVVDRDAESDRGLGYNQDIDLLAGRNGDLRIVIKLFKYVVATTRPDTRSS